MMHKKVSFFGCLENIGAVISPFHCSNQFPNLADRESGLAVDSNCGRCPSLSLTRVTGSALPDAACLYQGPDSLMVEKLTHMLHTPL